MLLELYNEDCLIGMQRIPDKSVDAIICDLPYGTTACKWDTIIPFEPLWAQYKRVIKDNGVIVLFGSQPFTSTLIVSNLDMFKYCWTWEKENGTNFITSHYQPLRVIEEIAVFSFGATAFVKNRKFMKYNPQFTEGKPYSCVSGKQKAAGIIRGGKGGWDEVSGTTTTSDGKRYPKNIIKMSRDKDKLHQTQKPLPLLDYLVRTYTNEGDTILDNTMGSGTTGVACVNTDRNFIGFELDKTYFEIAKNRIDEALLTKLDIL